MKICNSDYAYDLIKGCKFGCGLDKEDKLKCSCTKNCAMCSVGGKVTETLLIKAEKASKWGQNISDGKGGIKTRMVKRIAPIIPREINSRQVPIWMHPELHEAYIKKQAVSIRSNIPKGRVKKAT